MGSWITFRQTTGNERAEGGYDAVIFQGKGDCEMQDMYFTPPMTDEDR